MIVYEVDRRWFCYHHEANQYRIAKKLKPSTLHRHEVKDRAQLAALLNGIEQTFPDVEAMEPQALPDINIRELMEAQDDEDEADQIGVPNFLRNAS
jgi:hypothetical protein